MTVEERSLLKSTLCHGMHLIGRVFDDGKSLCYTCTIPAQRCACELFRHLLAHRERQFSAMVDFYQSGKTRRTGHSRIDPPTRTTKHSRNLGETPEVRPRSLLPRKFSHLASFAPSPHKAPSPLTATERFPLRNATQSSPTSSSLASILAPCFMARCRSSLIDQQSPSPSRIW